MVGLFVARSGSGPSPSTRAGAVVSRIRKAGDHLRQAFWSGQSLESFINRPRPSPSTRRRAVRCRRCANGSALRRPCPLLAGLRMHVEKVIDVAVRQGDRRIERRLLVLATVSSAGRFVGLCRHRRRRHDQLRSIAASPTPGAAQSSHRHGRRRCCDGNWPRRRRSGDYFYDRFTSGVDRQAPAARRGSPTNSRRSCRGSTSAGAGTMAGSVIASTSSGRHGRRRRAVMARST